MDAPSFPPGFFDRLDPTSDRAFYAAPRFVTHIDDGAIDAVGALYDELGIEGRVLDLCSSWVSHFTVAPEELVGLGLNEAELARNPQLTSHVVHDLNAEPSLPFDAERFDHVVCCVSVDYLADPLAVFAEVAQVLRPGGLFVVTFSNRMFPTKAVRGWLQAADGERPGIVRRYFAATPGFGPATADLRTSGAPAPGDPAGRDPGDPLWGVWASRR